MGEEVENKVKGIIGLYNFYKHNMTTPQRVGLLTVWIEVSVSREEYEMAGVLQSELDKILNGEEEYIAEVPMLTTFTSTMYDVDDNYVESIKKYKKKLKFINYWGGNQDSFHLINISFGDFKFILLNFGLEMK